jgi:hypothetical protein
MQEAATLAGALYLLAGIAVYAFSDTRDAASRLEARLVAVPFGTVQKHLFLFVVLLWPLWLALQGSPRDSE